MLPCSSIFSHPPLQSPSLLHTITLSNYFTKAWLQGEVYCLQFCLCLFLTFTDARELLVGGKPNAWKIPSSESDSLNKWAGASRCQVGDSLVWNYDSSKDSVIQVSKNDYETCNTLSPIAAYKDGNTKVKLEKSGAYYFISGAEGHCQKGLKLIVEVMSARSQLMGISPAPSPIEIDGPAVAPTSSGLSLKCGLVVTFGGLMGLALF